MKNPLDIPVEEATLRDYFAGQAIVAQAGIPGKNLLAQEAYELADAMLKERTHLPEAE